jgi:hypothetical protein
MNDGCAAGETGDRGLHIATVGVVVAGEQIAACAGWKIARELGEEGRIVEGAVEVDHEARDQREVERDLERGGEVAGELERAGIPGAVRVEEAVAGVEERGKVGGDQVAAVFAGEEEGRELAV